MDKHFSEEELFAAVKRLQQDEYFKQLRTAEERQAYVQRMLGIERKSIDGIGQPTMEIDPMIYHAAARVEEDSKGNPQYGVWRDPIFQKRMAEEGVLRKVKAGGTKEIHVGYHPAVAAATQTLNLEPETRNSETPNRRFHKVYS